MNTHWWRQIFLGNAAELDLYSARRILVNAEFRLASGIEKEVMLFGMGSHLELGVIATYAVKEPITTIVHDIPEALKQFNF